MPNPETLKYQTNSGEIEIRLTEEGEAYLSQSAMARLFGKERTVIARHAKSAVGGSDSVCAVCADFAHTAPDGKTYSVTHYPMSIVLEIGRKIRSDEGEKLKGFVDAKLAEKGKQASESIIIYNNGAVSLPVTVSPDEDTVWLTQNQIAELFGTTVQNVSAHIQNIREDGELDCTQFFKKSLNNPPEEGSGRSAERYNLDVILAVGYRVKSGRAVEFRRWASWILKSYIRRGYALDERRVIVSPDNAYKLKERVDALWEKVDYLMEKDEAAKEELFHPGELLEARIHVKSLIQRAKRSVVLVDPYASLRALDFLKGKRKGVSLTVYYSSPSQLTEDDIDSFRKEYGEITTILRKDFHDRYLIIDQKEAFIIGASLNQIGQKSTMVCQMRNQAMIDCLIAEFPLKKVEKIS